MKIPGVIITCCVIGVCGGAWGDTCIKTEFNVSYSCNGGTKTGTLPSDTTATYSSYFSPTAITASMCSAPSGYVYAGQAIIIDGETVAYYSNTSAKSFSYYYPTDIEIGPHWVPVAEPATLVSHLKENGLDSTYSTGASSGTWAVRFYYGAVSGVSKCTNVVPENTSYGDYTGLVADQDAVEGATAGGANCYCKMTEPYIATSPWVFVNLFGNASSCASNCAGECGFAVQLGPVFRASVFAGAGD